MTPGYIPWDHDLLRPLLHGLLANIPRWSFTMKWVHGHRCTGCQHRVACTCRDRPRELVGCPWCTPWLMQWAEPAAKKRARRKATRRPSRVVA